MARLTADDGALDVIVAPATPPGRSALAVVRMSGPPGGALAVLRRLAPQLRATEPQPRRACLCRLQDEDRRPLDQALALFFPAPFSATGEEVVELSCHGSPAVVEAVLAASRRAGARPARPGEFTRRALANGKVDLAEAEGVASLTAAESRGAARRALGLVDGLLSRKVAEVREGLLSLLTEMEAGFDFAEDVSFVSAGAAAERLLEEEARLEALLAAVAPLRADRLPEVVLAGSPNAGKSTLFNALLGRDRAIVTEVPGTTRDALSEVLDLSGEAVRLFDTAGLRETSDRVERIGVDVARATLSRADQVVLVVDGTVGPGREEEDLLSQPGVRARTLVVGTKSDLGGWLPGADVRVSAVTGEGLGELRERLRERLGLVEVEGQLPALERHREALSRAGREVAVAREALPLGDELAAAGLRRAVVALGEITGETATEELLGRIFASFCIGK